MFTFTAESESDTRRFGAALADVLPPGSVVGLIGPLGAGKTRLVQAVAEALGTPPEVVTSPTFVLVNEYVSGRLPLFHFDLYRLKDENEFLDIGPDEYFRGEGISLIEWADRFADDLPAVRLEITLEIIGPTSRLIMLRGTSRQTEALVARVAAALADS